MPEGERITDVKRVEVSAYVGDQTFYVGTCPQCATLLAEGLTPMDAKPTLAERQCYYCKAIVDPVITIGEENVIMGMREDQRGWRSDRDGEQP